MRRIGEKKRQRKAEGTSKIPCEEVIFTILSKLPVKSLLRFRCVCKTWLALISDPHFIKSHLTESIKSDRQRVIYSVNKSSCFYSVEYENSSENPVKELHFPVKNYHNASVLCSCNGLLLLGLDDDTTLVLWNPSTREFRKFSSPCSLNINTTLYGLCYDSAIDDDYYVILIYPRQSAEKKFILYRCKTNSWTETKGGLSYTNFMFLEKTGVTVNGAPHWFVYLEKGHNHQSFQGLKNNLLHPNFISAIVYFDLAEENFREVPPPNWVCDGDLFGLTVIRECLGLYSSITPERFDMLVMKEYGERTSWTKLISISQNAVSLNLYNLRPLCITKKSEVVMSDSDRLQIVLYSPEQNKFRNVTPSPSFSYFAEVVSCVDSLVLPTFL